MLLSFQGELIYLQIFFVSLDYCNYLFYNNISYGVWKLDNKTTIACLDPQFKLAVELLLFYLTKCGIRVNEMQ